MMHRHEAVKSALAHHVHPCLGHPAALLVAHGDYVARTNAQPVRVSEAGCEHVQLATVGADADERAAMPCVFGALGEIKVAPRVCLEAGCE